MSKPSQVIVVLEDDHHKMLIYRYLVKSGIKSHAVRIERSPSAEGSAENWVRKKFVEEVTVYRSRHAQTQLIVVLDADNGTVQDRLNQLDQALKDSGENAVRSQTEQVARLVPKRNVETWILCLNGHSVDEQTNYKKKDDWNKLIPLAAETLLLWTRANDELPKHCVDSLRHGVNELTRLKS